MAFKTRSSMSMDIIRNPQKLDSFLWYPTTVGRIMPVLKIFSQVLNPRSHKTELSSNESEDDGDME